jgi:hypothetical protein
VKFRLVDELAGRFIRPTNEDTAHRPLRPVRSADLLGGCSDCLVLLLLQVTNLPTSNRSHSSTYLFTGETTTKPISPWPLNRWKVATKTSPTRSRIHSKWKFIGPAIKIPILAVTLHGSSKKSTKISETSKVRRSFGF